MKFSTLTPYFKFSKSQRIGIFILFVAIVAFQFFYFFIASDTSPSKPIAVKQEWIEMQVVQDSSNNNRKQVYTMRPFNPNFITDFKGYRLGMSVEEIDRLLAYRKTNRYVNSTKEFQEVTKVSDSLLRIISPYFKFPDWVNKRNQSQAYRSSALIRNEVKILKDINLASAEDLKKVYGIGDGLSARILVQREKFGSFVSMKQLEDIWGLSPEVIEKLNLDFKVITVSNLKKININQSGIKELMQFPYFRYPVAKAIITYRSMNGGIKSIEDLSKISGFPIDKIEIIALYLEF